MSDVNYPPEALLNEAMVPRSGNWVFWFHDGDIKNKPCAALVNMDADNQRVLSLTVFTVNGPQLRDGVKHVDFKASKNDRQMFGGWAWNRTGKGA